MRKSLTAKMFFTLFISFTVLTLAIMLFLFLYFNNSYKNIKITKMTSAINSFAEDYINNDWTDQQLYQELSDFNDTHNASLTLTVYGEAFYSESIPLSGNNTIIMDENVQSSYLVTILLEDEFYDMLLDEDDYFMIFDMQPVQAGSKFQISGYIDESRTILPVSINNTKLNDGNILLGGYDAETLKKFEGEADYIATDFFSNIAFSQDTSIEPSIPSEDLLSSYYDPSYNTFFGDFPDVETIEKNGVICVVSKIPYTNIEQVDFTKMLRPDDSLIILNAYMSLHSVNEIASTMTSFLPWFLLGSLLLALAIALIYSKTVSRPIIQITKTADAMAGMDLDVRSDIKRQDELGRLSASLNTLSSNLSNTMTELVEKNRQLAEDFAQKERQEEARKSFIANASHELKTPLGVIKSYTEAIRDGIKEDKEDYYMDVILDEITHMDRLLVEMMQLSKFDAAADKMMNESVNIDSLFSRVTEKLEPSAKAARLSFDIKNPLGSVTGDIIKLYQVVYNLTANAVKYSNPGTVIEVESILKNGNNAIYIKNSCQPLSDNDLEHIWERFYKVDTSHTRESEGSGLGLAIVKSILDAHEADYGVYNTRKGICFYFSLPWT